MMFTIIFPVLNERLRLENGVTRTVEYLQSIAFEDYEIIIVDNGSEDETPQIAEKLCKKYDKVRYERINVRGVGAAFRRGVEVSHGDVVGYMDIDQYQASGRGDSSLRDAARDPVYQRQPFCQRIRYQGQKMVPQDHVAGTVDSVKAVLTDEIHGCYLRIHVCPQRDGTLTDRGLQPG